MGRHNNQLKALANIAKKRLMSGEYNEKEEKTAFVPKVSNYFIKNASALKKLTAKIEFVKISGKINSDFEKKVFDVLQENCDELNPFAKLIDYEFFNHLDEIEQQSYMLNIAEQYAYLKENYLKKESLVM